MEHRQIERKQRTTTLSPAEAKRYRTIRQQIQFELPEIVARRNAEQMERMRGEREIPIR